MLDVNVKFVVEDLVNVAKFSDRQVRANNVDPDHTAPEKSESYIC